jgi:hypothetical protein
VGGGAAEALGSGAAAGAAGAAASLGGAEDALSDGGAESGAGLVRFFLCFFGGAVWVESVESVVVCAQATGVNAKRTSATMAGRCRRVGGRTECKAELGWSWVIKKTSAFDPCTRMRLAGVRPKGKEGETARGMLH